MIRFEKFDQKLAEHIRERQQTIQNLSPSAREAYNKWVGMRKQAKAQYLAFPFLKNGHIQERSFLAALPAEIRIELGLICKCCGTCKTGQQKTPAKSRAARSAAANLDVDQLAKGLMAMSDLNALNKAAGMECSY